MNRQNRASERPNRPRGGNSWQRRPDRRYRPGMRVVGAYVPLFMNPDYNGPPPESAFRPHRIHPSPPRRRQASPEREYTPPPLEIEERQNIEEPQGYAGRNYGLERCGECKTWCNPATLRDNKCRDCASKDIQVNSEQTNEP
jgi:hypothetical protein